MKSNLIQNVRAEFIAMQECGMYVPKKVFKYLEENQQVIADYRSNGMAYSEIADLIIQLV